MYRGLVLGGKKDGLLRIRRIALLHVGAEPRRRVSRPSQMELDSFRRDILNLKKTPLGTMDESQWDNALLAIYYFLRLDYVAKEAQPFVKGTSVDSCDLLVDRMTLEATLQTPAAARKISSLPPASLAVWQNWIRKATFFPNADLPLEKGLARWNQIKDWHDSGVWEEDIPWSDYVTMIEAFASAKTEISARVAVDLLVSEDTQHIFEAYRDRLSPCYHNSLRLGLETEDNELVTRIMREMNRLFEAGYSDFEPDLTSVMASLQTGQAKFEEEQMSTFEKKALKTRMLTEIENAGDGDHDKVGSILNFLQKTENVDAELSSTLTRYFVRIKDVSNSVKWLLKAMGLSHNELNSLVTEVVDFLATSGDPDAHWRADEVVLAFESKHDKVSDSLLMALAQMWWTSNEPRAGRRTMMYLARVGKLDLPGVCFGLEVLSSGNVDIQNEDAIWVMEHAERLLDQYSLSESESFLPLTFAVLGQAQDLSLLERFVTFTSEKGIALTTQQSNAILRYASSKVDVLMRVLKRLQDSPASLDFHSFATVLLALEANGGNAPDKQVLPLFEAAMKELEIEFAEITIADIHEVIYASVSVFCTSRDLGAALDLMKVAESYLIEKSKNFTDGTFPVPLSAYKRLLQTSVTKGELRHAEDIFAKVRGYGKDGYNDMIPGADFVGILMSGLYKEGASTLETREKLLEEVIESYRKYDDDRFKPIDRMFNGIIGTYRKVAADAIPQGDKTTKSRAARNAIALLDCMLEIGVEVKDSFAFTTVTHLIILGEIEPIYSRVMDVATKLKTTEVSSANQFLLKDIFRACYRALPEEQDAAIGSLLEAMSAMRESGWMDESSYGLVLRALTRIMPPVTTPIGSTVWQKVFDLCCADGCFGSDSRQLLRQMATPGLWERCYTRRLVHGQEPQSWSKNAQS